nr:putative integron gene cassette protein [uncultured bacterium]
MFLLGTVNFSQDDDRTPASCTELVLCASNAVHPNLRPQTECGRFQAARSMWSTRPVKCAAA